MMHNRFVGVPRHKQYPRVGANGLYQFGDLFPACLRHDHVRKHKIDGAGMLSSQMHSFFAPAGFQNLGSETILLVEDEAVVRGLARQILEQAGYKVLEASGGEEAVHLTTEHSGAIDLVLTDVVMPKASGKEIAELIKSIRPDARVLFMSGYTDEAIVHHGVLDSGVEFIQKPFTPASLARKVREVLESEPPAVTGG